MNHEDLFEAIGAADERMLEKSEHRPRRKKKIIFASIAACLVLAIAIGAFVQPAETQRLICPEQITWSVSGGLLIEESDNMFGMILDVMGPEYQFSFDISIEAKVLEVLPDTYSIPGASTGSKKYRILRLKVVDEIIATDFPEEIYYRLPETLDPNLMEYDSLILNLKQVGIENYQMLNENQRQIEAFTYLFGQATYAPDYGAVMAFKNNKLDLGLWNKEGWDESKQWAELATADAEWNYPGQIDRNIEETKEAILQQAQRFKKDGEYKFYTGVITSNYFNWLEAAIALKYVEPFENGTFKQYFYADESVSDSGEVGVSYTRIINGFSTNEVLRIARTYDGSGKAVSRSGERFTQQDMEDLPDLVSVIENIGDYLPQTYWGTDAMEHFCGVRGEYHKVDDVVYGVVVIEWGDPSYEEPKGPTCLIGMKVCEYTHILVLQDGTSRVVTEEELESYIGS